MTLRLRIRRLAAETIAASFLVAAATGAHAQDKTIKIGALLPISGPGSYFGVQDKQGVELALEQLNKAAGAGANNSSNNAKRSSRDARGTGPTASSLVRGSLGGFFCSSSRARRADTSSGTCLLPPCTTRMILSVSF